MNGEDIDFFESLSKTNDDSNQSNSSQSKYTSNMYSKRPQVYSSYIQPNLPPAFNSKHQSNNNFKTQPNDYAKKPKMSQETLILSASSSLDNHYAETIPNQNDSALINTLSSFIGLQTFESENVFSDLTQKDMVLFSLDNQTNSKKNNLCFKGMFFFVIIFNIKYFYSYYLFM